ncbi:hypothetical protein BDV06DRAFT_19288 [Aspergillus oleicola]
MEARNVKIWRFRCSPTVPQVPAVRASKLLFISAALRSVRTRRTARCRPPRHVPSLVVPSDVCLQPASCLRLSYIGRIPIQLRRAAVVGIPSLLPGRCIPQYSTATTATPSRPFTLGDRARTNRSAEPMTMSTAIWTVKLRLSGPSIDGARLSAVSGHHLHESTVSHR